MFQQEPGPAGNVLIGHIKIWYTRYEEFGLTVSNTEKILIEILIISGDAGFPLNSIYTKPSSAEESDNIRQYFLQLRHETGNFKRYCDHCIGHYV